MVDGLMPTLDIYNNSRPRPKEKETLYSDLLKKFLNKFPELKIAFDGDEEGIEEKRNNIYRMIYSFKKMKDQGYTDDAAVQALSKKYEESVQERRETLRISNNLKATNGFRSLLDSYQQQAEYESRLKVSRMERDLVAKQFLEENEIPHFERNVKKNYLYIKIVNQARNAPGTRTNKDDEFKEFFGRSQNLLDEYYKDVYTKDRLSNLTTRIIQFIESTVGSANHFEQVSAQSESARKSRPVAQDTLSRALQRAGYSKSLKTPPQTVTSSMVPLPNTSPFVQSPRPNSTAVSTSQPAAVEDLLLLDNATRFKNYLESPETVYFTHAVIRLDGKEFTASNCERAAQAVLLFDSLEKLRVEITNVHGIPTGRLNKLRESIVAKSSNFAAFELILNRSKLNKQEIRAFGDMFANLESVDSIVRFY